MPTDKHGHPLVVGDLVMVPCIVETVRERGGFNLGLKTHHPMITEDADDSFLPIVLNSSQVELVDLDAAEAVEEA